MYTVHGILHALLNVHCTLYTGLLTVHRTLYTGLLTVHCTLYTGLLTVHCTLYTGLLTVHRTGKKAENKLYEQYKCYATSHWK